jgi:hypothetical protein
MESKKSAYFIYSVIALLYAFALSLIPEVFFRDRNSYLEYAIGANEIFNRYLEQGLLTALTNEPLFLGLNYLLSGIISPESIPRFFSFFVSFVVVFFLLKEGKGVGMKIMALLLWTFVPFCFHLQLVTLRQGLGLALLLIVLMASKKEKPALITAFIIGFIHSSFFILFFFLLLINFIRNKRFSTQVIIIVTVSLVFSMVTLTFARMLGMRQVELYEGEESRGSGLSFLLYLALLCLLLSRGESFLKNYRYYAIAIMGLTVYLAFYLTNPFAGRLIGSFMPFIICALLKTTKSESYIFIVIFLLANLLIFKNSVINNSLTLYS